MRDTVRAPPSPRHDRAAKLGAGGGSSDGAVAAQPVQHLSRGCHWQWPRDVTIRSAAADLPRLPDRDVTIVSAAADMSTITGQCVAVGLCPPRLLGLHSNTCLLR